eukprot:TRINITY_DN2810_c0_g4_i1.p1 TRINITY_DN2810_c0_g4~~TRINITY_DN2810_c0_g4_i1.p1  ORF type:complete len:861 (+),score=210.89 TRINITY_DN2810_c0_g4_i1:1085-3667(+)
MSGYWSFRNDGIDGCLKEEHVNRALGAEGMVGRELQHAAMQIEDAEGNEDDVMGLLSKLRTFVGVASPVKDSSECHSDDDDARSTVSATSNASSTDAAIGRLREMLCLGTAEPEGAKPKADDVAETMQTLHKKVLETAQDIEGPRLEPNTLDPHMYPALFTVQLEAEKDRTPPPVVLPDVYDTTGIIRRRKKPVQLEPIDEPRRIDTRPQVECGLAMQLCEAPSYTAVPAESLEPTWCIERSTSEAHCEVTAMEASMMNYTEVEQLVEAMGDTSHEAEIDVHTCVAESAPMPDATPVPRAAAVRHPIPLPSPTFTISPATELSVSRSFDCKAHTKPVLTPLPSNTCHRSISISPITVDSTPRSVAVPECLPERSQLSLLTPQYSSTEPTFSCTARKRRSLPQISLSKTSLSSLRTSAQAPLDCSSVDVPKTTPAAESPCVAQPPEIQSGDQPSREVIEPSTKLQPAPHSSADAPTPIPLPDTDTVFKEALAKHYYNKICAKRAFRGWVAVYRASSTTSVQRAETVVQMLRSKARSKKDLHFDCMADPGPGGMEQAETTTEAGTEDHASPVSATTTSGSSSASASAHREDAFALKASARREKRLKAREELQQRYFVALQQKRQEEEERQRALEEQAAQEKRETLLRKREERAADEQARLEKEERKKIYKAKVRRAVTHYNRCMAAKCFAGFRKGVVQNKRLNEVAERKGNLAVLRHAVDRWKGSAAEWKKVHMVVHIFRCVALRRLLLQCLKRGFLRRWRGVVTARKLDEVNAARLDRERVKRQALAAWSRAANARRAQRALTDCKKADELLNTFLFTRKKRLFTRWKDRAADTQNQKQRMLFRKRMAEAIRDIAGDVLCP